MRRTAVITGASRGAGAATAIELASRGYQVVVNHRDSAEEAEQVVAEIAALGGEAVSIRADVTCPDEVAGLVYDTETLWGNIDVLVHGANLSYAIASFVDVQWEQLVDKLTREMQAAFLLTKAVTPGMIERSHGRLLYLSTALSRYPRAGMINLGVAKAAMDQFVRYVAMELAVHGITANVVAPINPQHVGKAAAAYACDDAGLSSGQWIPVNDGMEDG